MKSGNDRTSKLEIAELLTEVERRGARKDFLKFTRRVNPLPLARHHEFLIKKLQDVSDGKIKRLMIFMPPGSAKSTIGNMDFSAFWLGAHPGDKVICASYAQDLADRWGSRTRNLVSDSEYTAIFGIGLAGDSQARDHWGTSNDGEYLAAGIGARVTGFRADLVIIDDPVKGRAEADSEDMRQRTQEWYSSDLWTRLKPGGAIVVIQTRWHEADLSGWLLSDMEAGGEKWEVVSLPMIAEENDALGREVGEQLWPEWFRPEMITQAKRNARDWAALYQQRPSPEEGDYFKAEWLYEYDTLPDLATLRCYGASDYAVTKGGGDFTAHMVVGVAPDHKMYVVDLWRGQTDSMVWIDEFTRLVRRWKPLEWAEESGQILGAVGPFLVRRMLETGTNVYRRQFPSRADKSIRAQAIRGRMAMHGLYLPRGVEWASTLRHEMLHFPSGRNDDMVDCASLVGQMLDHVMPGHAVKPMRENSAMPTWNDVIDFNERRLKSHRIERI